MEKSPKIIEINKTINFYDSLPKELLPEISLFCKKSTFAKIYFLTAKQAKKEFKAAIASQTNTIFKQSFSAWKELDENTIRNAVACLQEEVEITALLTQINLWIKSLKGSKRFHEWIKRFGDEYCRLYKTEESNFKTSEHQALYYLVTANTQAITNCLNNFIDNDEALKKNYPLIVSSLRKSCLIIELSNAPDDVTTERLFKELQQLQQQTEPAFINLAKGNYIRKLSRLSYWKRKEVMLTGANLTRETDLNRADLRRANLSGANLSGAILSIANLSEAILNEAILSGTILTGANLSSANLKKANLTEANLRVADLEGTDLSRANLSRATLNEAKLSGANLFGADLNGATLSGANFSGANLEGIKNYDQINFNGANLTGVMFISEHSQSIKHASWSIVEKKIQQAGVAQLSKIYEDSMCKGNLWDIQRNPILDNFFRFFTNIISHRKILTTHRKKLNTAIIQQANQLMANASDTEKSQLENLINKVYDSELIQNPISADVKLAANLRP